jgi:hypothetical protein
MNDETIQALRHASQALSDISTRVQDEHDTVRLKACGKIIDMAVSEAEEEHA